jgi:hypothetical protein
MITATCAHTNLRALPEDPYRTCTDRDVASAREAERRGAQPGACAHCGAQLLMAEQAATLCRHNRRLIYRWVEQGALDFYEAADGVVWVCSRTLLIAVERLEEATARLRPV